MAKEDQKLRQQAQRLASLSLDSTGQVSPARVSAVLSSLAARTVAPLKQRALLKQYEAAVKRELGRSQVIIEHSGPIADDTAAIIAASFSTKTGRVISAVTKPNDSLLAGIRVILGDHVYDASAKARLDRLAAAS